MNYEELRLQMVEQQLKNRDIFDFRVLDTMKDTPRHEFVPESLRHLAYEDRPLGIGHEQTISQPYIVAAMLQTLQLSGHERILEVGTGSGYQTALLCQLASYVFSIERNPELAESAAERLEKLGYTNVDVHIGDGSQGLADMAPYDAIIVGACVPNIPGPLRAQMQHSNGRMVLPVGSRDNQYLQLVRRDYDRWEVENLIPVRFVPLIGRYGFSGR